MHAVVRGRRTARGRSVANVAVRPGSIRCRARRRCYAVRVIRTECVLLQRDHRTERALTEVLVDLTLVKALVPQCLLQGVDDRTIGPVGESERDLAFRGCNGFYGTAVPKHVGEAGLR